MKQRPKPKNTFFINIKYGEFCAARQNNINLSVFITFCLFLCVVNNSIFDIQFKVDNLHFFSFDISDKRRI